MILWLNPFSGVAGDMLLGALLDLGAPLDAVRAAVASTGITDWELTAGQTYRQGLRACRATVTVAASGVPRRPAAELLRLVSAARPAPVADLAAAAVAALAEVEGQLHGVPAAEVELHEIGGIDTVVDVVGTAAAVHALGVTGTWSAPVALGTGTVQAAHGRLPAPAPATLILLAGAQVTGGGQTGETVTPTGAALLRALGCRYAPVPPMTLVRTGYGAGSRDTPGRPNVLPAVLGDPVAALGPATPGPAASPGLAVTPGPAVTPGLAAAPGLAVTPGPAVTPGLAAAPGLAVTPGPAAAPGPGGDLPVTETLAMVETTVDDVTGEVLAVTLSRLLAAGALDAWITPVTGKKGRPAQVISALCVPPRADVVQQVMLAETGSLGARRHGVQRHALPRSVSEVLVDGHRIRIKAGPYQAKPELDDVLAASAATGLPVRTVAERAMAAARRSPNT
jgi:pyridinium-3,5-bisthiocarboxylic acid mononucleotide nickel chelatase